MPPQSRTLDISDQSPLNDALRRAFWLFAILLALSVGIFALSNVFGTKMADAGHSTSSKSHEIVIANDVLAVPENMIRFAEQRTSGVTNRVDLYVLWPSRSGYNRTNATQFNDTNPDTSQLVFISLKPRERVLKMADRLAPVYKKAMLPAERTVHGGLTIRQLKPELGYTDELLAFALEPGAVTPRFIARCHHTNERALIAACETELFAGRTLEAHIRFPAHMLVDWRTLPDDLSAFIASLLVGSGQ